MRIVVLAHSLRVAGGKSVALNVIKSLLKLYPENEYLIFVPLDDDYKAIRYSKKCLVNYFSSSSLVGRALYDYVFIKNKIREFDPDVIWGLGNLGVATPPCKQVILLHKAQLVSTYKLRTHETWINRVKNFMLKKKLGRCLGGTQLVFCQTNVMKKKFLNTFPYNGEVSLFPNAVSTSINSVDGESERQFKDFMENKTRLLVLARYYPHKNLELLVNCFNRYRDELKGIVCYLTISRSDHKNAGALLDLIEEYDLSNNIVNIGTVNQSSLATYYSECDALLLPTVLESFSGTYIEAMQYETPIITSDLDFAHEICGKGAIYFDPYSEKDLKEKLVLFCKNNHIRAELIVEGKKQLNAYVRSWDEILEDAMLRIESIVNDDF